MKKLIILAVCINLLSTNLRAYNNPDLVIMLNEIKSGRTKIQNNSTVFLLICKQLDYYIFPGEEKIRVITPSTPIRNADLLTAEVFMEIQEGTEFTVLKREGEWFQVRLEDSRTGWIHQDNVQQLYDEVERDNKGLKPDTENYFSTRLIAESFYNQFTESFQVTEQYISDFEKKYNSLSDNDRQNQKGLYAEMSKENEIIQLARTYVNHYYQKLPPIQVIPSERIDGKQKTEFDGLATLRLGSSAYESGGQISETTRNISLAGNIVFNPLSKLALQLNHNNDVIRTPFTTSDVNATYFHEVSGGTRLRTSVNFQDYRDRFSTLNSYRDVGLGINAEHPLGEKTLISGDLNAQSKNFLEEGGNSFNGVQFNTLIDYKGEKTLLNAGIRGRFQSSEIAFLDYTRIMPNLRFTYRKGQKNISLYAEAEQLNYDIAAEFNNLNRVRVDLEHATPVNRMQLSVTSNNYPNKNDFNLLRFKILWQHSNKSDYRFGRSTVYAQYTFHTSDNNTLSNYIDLRYDKNFNSNSGYIDIGASGRYWEKAVASHRLSLFSRFGFKFSGIQIGPVVGADILIDPDDPNLKRTGNSYRAGVDGRGNFMIRKASIYSSARYQQTFLYSGFSTENDPIVRKPATLEITAGTRIPVFRQFELHFDLRYYSLDFDYPEISEGVPAQIQSGLRYLAGISYRFQQPGR